MKYSRTAIGLLTAQYRSVLKKCLLINLGLFALGAVTTAPANATELSVDPGTFKVGENAVTGAGSVSVTGLAIGDTAGLQDALDGKVDDADIADMATRTWVGEQGYLTSITSAQVTGALGFTPFNPANIIAADGEASDTNVYSASAIDTKLTGYATTATATTSANGLMSSTDKTKLDGISTAEGTSGTGYVTGELLGTTLSGYATTATATTSANGLMSSTDKTKLDGISTAEGTSGTGYVTGELLGTTLSGYATTATATTSANGLMSSTDKTKLDGIDTGAQVNVLEGITVGTTDATISSKKIVITSGETNGTISIGEQEVAVAGLGDAAFKGVATSVSDSADLVTAAAVNTALGSYATTTALGTKLTGTSADYVAGMTPEEGTYYTAESPVCIRTSVSIFSLLPDSPDTLYFCFTFRCHP